MYLFSKAWNDGIIHNPAFSASTYHITYVVYVLLTFMLSVGVCDGSEFQQDTHDFVKHICWQMTQMNGVYVITNERHSLVDFDVDVMICRRARSWKIGRNLTHYKWSS